MPSLRRLLMHVVVAVIVAFALIAAPGLAQQGGAPAASVSRVLRDYRPVTAERLKNPEDGNWLMIRGTYDGWGYSPLDPDHSRERDPAADGLDAADRRRPFTHQAPPIVNNGVMFVSTPNNQVIAFDAVSGAVLWRYRRPRPDGGVRAASSTNRGVALYGDKVFFAAGEAVLVALDARTGRELWTTSVADNKAGVLHHAGPARGRRQGHDRRIGWRVRRARLRGGVRSGYRVRSCGARSRCLPPGEPGSETWPKGDQWKTGGAPVWVTGNYDPRTNLAYWGTGNGGPWMGDQRPGDNLYVASTIAIDVRTGQIKGHFQYNPNESWDWDEVSPPILVDYQRNGRTIKGLIDVARNGYLWFLERTNGPIKFVEGKPYVNHNVFRSLDPITGRPDVDPARQARHREAR